MQNMIIPMQELNPKKNKPTIAEAMSFNVPIDALLDTVIVVHISEKEKEKPSGIYVPEHIKEQMSIADNHLVKALVKSVGTNKEGRKPVVDVHDVVYVYPGGFGAKIIIDGIEYLVYAERDMVAKVK